MLHRLQLLTIALLLPWFVTGARAQDDHDDHAHEDAVDEHNHGAESSGEADHDDHDDHADELVVELSPEAVALAGLKTSTALHGVIANVLELPGEVGFNEDKLAHIAPRFAGIALRANYRVGDYVEAGHVVAVVESNESMNSYTIPAPMSGWVIERHITPGEFVSEENSIYVIADLSSVWVNLAVYPKDCDRIKRGQVAQIKAVGTGSNSSGTIEYVTPIIDFRTRAATARIILPNPDNTWRPGTFVQATVATEGRAEALVVEKDAVQILDERSVVFVVEGPNKFVPVEVVTGERDNRHVQIVGGLGEGVEYVSHGAFELKAKIVTSNLDAHAGHGH